MNTNARTVWNKRGWIIGGSIAVVILLGLALWLFAPTTQGWSNKVQPWLAEHSTFALPAKEAPATAASAEAIPSEVPATEAPVVQEEPLMVVPVTGAELRSCASMENAKIVGVKSGDFKTTPPTFALAHAFVAGEDWVEIKQGDVEGWIMLKFLLMGDDLSKTPTDLSNVPEGDASCSAEELIAELDVPADPATLAPAVLDVVTYTPAQGEIPLVNKGETIGFFYVLNKKGPVDVTTPYQSTALFALGNGKVGDTTVTSDGTQGNIVTVLCDKPEGCVTTVTDYTAGHVGVTIVFAGKEVPAETSLGAVSNLFNAPNCGANGCPSVFHWQNGQSEAFVDVPIAVKLDIPWESVTVSTAIVGEPPANAKVIKIDKKIVGHAYTCSGECSVSVPEGAGGTVACFPEGGTADGEDVQPGGILSWNGTDTDSGTPEDLNNTVLLNGDNIQVVMIYLADLEPFMNVACGQ